MTIFNRIVAGISLLACVFLTSFSVQATEDGFKSLFDGKSLKDWDGDPTFWRIEEGVITGETTKEKPTKGNTFIIWKPGFDPADTNTHKVEPGMIGDFELHFDYRLKTGNSGCQYRSFLLTDGADRWRVGGYQADFEAGTKWTGLLYGEKDRGILSKRGTRSVIKSHKLVKKGKRTRMVAEVSSETFGDAAELQKKIKAWPEWNTYVVKMEGFKLQHIINGTLMTECTDEDEKGRKAEGVLAFQLHQGPPMLVQFRNVKIKMK